MTGILEPLIVVFVVLVVTFAMAFSLYTLMFPVQTASDRLEALTTASESTPTVDLTGDSRTTTFEILAARLGQLTQASSDATDEQTEEIKVLLKHAGYKSRRSLDVFNGVRVGAMMLLPVAISPVSYILEIQAVAFAMVLSAGFGYYGPLLILRSQASSRQADLLRSFPDSLDLLVSSVESGLGLDQAMRRVAQEMVHVAPILAREFTLVNSEVSAGVERLVALRHLEERTGLEEVRSLVNMLAQAERYGSSVADSLRIYSSVAREKRMARAEELAGQVGSKLTVIMIVFFLPVLMAILLMPSLIRMFSGEGP